ncbi:hypothetical protein LTR54_007140 [Friedmanniomyces endolithicus]|uniref:histidine kinase n=1 Tax=Friedmanniomyces endolithicus TaxID=329885 RepID=A0AAN6FYB0_9PEZI|nr:hypothetical protein LTR82_003237 [Friedmanniomyces endolithicus]KAK1005850.1 hypothetical protein LTR54_007140 [Friedmanniomyces endolithicus]
MDESTSKPSSQERKAWLQEREVHRFYQAWLSAHGSSHSVAHSVESIAQAKLHGVGYKAHVSRDKALSAFAQLAAFRLRVKRAIISLIDANNQYILAEGAGGASITSADDLWLGTTVLKRCDAVCEQCLDSIATGKNDDGQSYACPGLIVKDCLLDEKFITRPYVRAEAGVRFYAGVPIVSRSGIMLGAYAVFDDKPRNGLTADELRFLQETAGAVMEHLEWARDRVDKIKGGRIVRGMASFIEGCTSLEGRHDDMSDVDRTVGDQTSTRTNRTDSPSRTPRRPDLRQARGTRASSASPSRSANSPARSANGSSPPKPRVISPPTPEKPRKAESASAMFARAVKILRESTLADGAAIFGATAGGTSTESSNATTSAFNHANPQFTPSTTSGQPSIGAEVRGGDSNSSELSVGHAGRPCKVLAYALSDDRARSEIESGSTLSLETLERYFVLFPKGKVFYFTEKGTGLSSGDETEGGVGEEDVAPSVAAGARNTKQARRRSREMDHLELLRKIPGARNVVFVPLYDVMEERLMAGCFLWTSITGQSTFWYPFAPWQLVREVFLDSTSQALQQALLFPLFVLHLLFNASAPPLAPHFPPNNSTCSMMNLDDDLSYLRAFGNSIMSEVGRLSVQKNEAAKTTFIASMSHELRSPLHGILGAAEFLVDTATDSYQAGLITSIATCGKTLLDTLNHVLDYSKINKLGRTQMRRNDKQNKGVKLHSDANMDSINMTAEVDLGVLVEEVVEAVTAGHAFAKLQHGSILSTTNRGNGSTGTGRQIMSVNSLSGSESNAQESSAGSVSVLLDIEPKRSWLVRTQAGALRRIIMNLLGNSLKYTSSGFVAVSLRASEGSEDASKIHALVRVVDSGKGMADDYLRDRLFVPFSQEDTFQPGTGLGLSIVKQIVDSLGGTINVQSDEGVGTEVEVSLCLNAADQAASDLALDDITRVLAPKVQGLHMVLLDPWAGRPDTERTARLQKTLREVCERWFGMRVSKSTLVGEHDADFYLYSEPPPIEALVEALRTGGLKAATGKKIPLILVCLNAANAIAVSRDSSKRLVEAGAVVEVIPQPCGPRKLARALGLCLKKVHEVTETSREAREGELGSVLNSAEGVAPSRRTANASESAQLSDPKRSGSTPPSWRREHKTANESVPLSSAVAFPSPPPSEPKDPGGEKQLRTPSKRPEEAIEKGGNSTGGGEPDPNAPLRILVVDDNNINLHLLTTFMKRNGYDYSAAENGLLAVQNYRENCAALSNTPSNGAPPRTPIDYVLMDINMPIMNSVEATKRIREIEREFKLEPAGIIALTGLGSTEAKREAEAAGVDVFMPKPVKFGELKKLLVKR